MLEQKLVGTSWKLISFQSQDKNDEIIYPLGNDAKGYISFSNAQRMSVQIMSVGENKIFSEDEIALMNTSAEQKMRKLGYHAYTGSYEINESTKLLTTTVELSLITEYINSKQRRVISLDEEHNRLYLSNAKHPERKLIWEKL